MVTTEHIAQMLDRVMMVEDFREQAFSDVRPLPSPAPAAARNWAVGNDLVLLSAFEAACTPQFVHRVFTAEELAYCSQFSDPLAHFASTWAAKEAVYKALKQLDGDIRLWWRNIAISRNKPSGKPDVAIDKLPFPIQCSLTLTHDGDMVWAVAVVLLADKQIRQNQAFYHAALQ